MLRRGIATFTLDDGRCPAWLFQRMVKLGREILDILVDKMGPDEFITRIADPAWFQSLGTVLAFDWNASGLTTILTAALKEAVRGRERELGIFVCGGKGKTSLKTPDEIRSWGERLSLPGGMVSNLEYNSKMAAKVDSSLVQDGYQIYHHAFFFSRTGHWAVVQQGMNQKTVTARRYHWYSKNIKDLVCEPHLGIVSKLTGETLNLAAKDSGKTRDVSVELVGVGYGALMKDIGVLRRHSSRLSQTLTVQNRQGNLFTWMNLESTEFRHHPVEVEDFSKSRYLEKILSRVTYEKPESYEKLVATPGVGPKTVRALALVSEVIYGAAPSYEDPARYSFAFGGKDATPYPVDRPTYDRAIEILKRAVSRSAISAVEKDAVACRLERREKRRAEVYSMTPAMRSSSSK